MPSRPESSQPWHWLLKSRTSFFSVASGELAKVQMRPSRSQTQRVSLPGTEVRPVQLVKRRLVKATTADQLPEMAGATSGIAPSRKAPASGR